MKNVVLIKLGGSLITDKTKPRTVRQAVLNRLALWLAETVKFYPHYSYILGNGAGSFAHVSASKYQIQKGLQRDEQKFGFCEVGLDVSRLRSLILETFIAQQLRIFPVRPSSFITLKNKQVETVSLAALEGMLELGVTPLISGDIFYDSERGFYIYSTEAIFEVLVNSLAPSYRVTHCIHFTTVEGVYDDKKHVIPTITEENFDQVRTSLYATEGYDVTGGMLHKIEKSLYYAQQGITTHIVSGVSHKNPLLSVLSGKDSVGTTISLRRNSVEQPSNHHQVV